MWIVHLLGNLTLKAKIIGLAAVLLLAMTGSGLYALQSMSLINSELVAIAEEDIPLTKVLTHITTSQLEQAISFERALRYGEEMVEAPRRRASFDQALQDFARFSQVVKGGLQQGEKLAAEAADAAHSDQARAEFQKLLGGLKAIEHEYVGYEEHASQALELAKQSRALEAWDLVDRVEAEEKRIDHAMRSLLGEIEVFTEQAAKTAEAHEQHAQSMMYIILGLSILLGISCACWVISDAIRRIEYAITIAETVASGDLRQAVDATRNDEIGRLLAALGGMRDSLFHMVIEMHESSNGLAVASEELSTATSQMSTSVDGQRVELQQAATTFNQMTASVQEVSHSVCSTAEAAQNASLASQEGKKVICDAVNTIRGLAEEVEASAGVIQQLGKDSQTIGSVIDVIKSIAEQTNLLALNAAIEAARAGEQGRGFAVVADEVRTLAQRTQQSTQEIEDMIERLQASAQSAVHSMEDGREHAQQSVQKATAAGEALRDITTAIGAISDMSTQIAGATEEQIAVSEDINRNLTAISGGAEQNAAAMVQTGGASEELAKMAVSLQGMIGRFKVA